jgi:GTP cyclohydrolase I
MKETIKQLLKEIGVDMKREEVQDTPVRVERLFSDFFTYDKKLKVMTSEERNSGKIDAKIIPVTVFNNKEKFNDIIIDRGEFISFCSHHIVPFFGNYYFAYLPGKYIVGKSKIDSVVKYFSGRLQIQERLSHDIADWFYKNLQAQGVMLILRAKHLCEYLTTDKISDLTTSAVRGNFMKKDVKDEAIKLMGIRM